MFARITKVDDDKRLVTGEVYAPNVIDVHGAMMLKADVTLLAHRFLEQCNMKTAVDRQHSQKSESCVVVESYIAEGHPEYTEGAWVATVRVDDDTLWQAVKSGEVNGFSFDVWAFRKQAVVEVLIDPTVVGQTEESNSHTHFFFAKVNDDGKIVSGRTSTENGHSHEILRGTATEMTDGHSHRFFV